MATGTAKDWVSRKKAAAILADLGCCISPATLARKAVNNNAGKGPPFNRSGWKTVRYHVDDLKAWAAKNVERVE